MINLTDDLLRAAAADVRTAMLDALPAPEECSHTFSPQFERKMQKLIRQQKAGYRLLRQVAAVFLALLVGSGVWLMVDTEAKAAFIHWVRTVYENSIVYRFFGSDTPEVELTNYRPAWLPEGYVETMVIAEDSISLLVEYRNDENDVIYFHCFPMNDSVVTSIIPNGKITSEDVAVNGMYGTVYYPENMDESNEMIWFNEELHIAYGLSSYLEKSVMLHIAESVSLDNSTN